MKNSLKIFLIFVLGLAAGSGVTVFITNKVYQSYLTRVHTINVAGSIGENAMLAWNLREGDVEIGLKTAENNLTANILTIHGNDELKNATLTEGALKLAKEYYVCTKTDYPSEIAVIMNDLPAVPESSCNVNDKK